MEHIIHIKHEPCKGVIKSMLKQINSPSHLAEIREKCKVALARQKSRFLVCAGTGCVASGSFDVYNELQRMIKEKGIYCDVALLFEEEEKKTKEENNAGVTVSGCHGFCQVGPLVRFEQQHKEILYTKVKVEDVAEIIETTLEQGKIVERLLYENPDGSHSSNDDEIAFYNHQQRIVLANCGRINPEEIREYFAAGGYQSLAKSIFDSTPESIVNVITSSGLRGRGGGGFPTGRKLASAQKALGTPKYIICNGDEGDPGAFMDRSVLEGDPHAVLEGMSIAAYAIGASQGYIYVRAEYPLAVARLKIAIEQAKQWGLLGENIMGTDFSFEIKIFQGAGAFVCGESTALVYSIEGLRGMPKPLPRPRTTAEGLWGKPTSLNNVKTFALIPEIINRGANLFANTGTETSSGTAVFALTGKVRNNGLIEVPMGVKLREIIFDIGGGTLDGNEFKAVQIGGPSGGCLPKEMLDLEVDFDSLLKASAMMGSGGMVVLDETSCMVDISRYFLQFTVNESCGQCTPCREGTQQMLKILEDITTGKATMEDLLLLEEMGKAIITSSICGLGNSAPNPVLSTLRYFRSEYEAHIKDKSCPALYCKELIIYHIDSEKCKACGLCRKECPENAISGEKKVPHIIEQAKCNKCGICIDTCPDKFNAIIRLTGQQKTAILEEVKK